MGTKAYQDRIYPKLLQNNIRNKILRRTLAREDYSNPEVYDFLQLLNMNGAPYESTEQFRLITIDEWKLAVKQAKHMSISSIFSKRNYALYKYSICNNRIMAILVKYYNTIIQRQFYLQR